MVKPGRTATQDPPERQVKTELMEQKAQRAREALPERRAPTALMAIGS
ncbi:MAG: hypothetical protein AAFY88_09950 [Acidobacteriota bacterium]